jgi:hypothetical protein
LKNEEEKHEIITYYDFPPIYSNQAEEISQGHRFDIMICIFKDSTSFGQLYELLESITVKSDENNE